MLSEVAAVVVVVEVVVVVGATVTGGLVPPWHSGTFSGKSQFPVAGLKYKLPGHTSSTGTPLSQTQNKLHSSWAQESAPGGQESCPYLSDYKLI